MKVQDLSASAVAAGIGLALILALWLKKKGVAGVAGDVVGVAADAGQGVVLGVGDVFGLPRTDPDACAKARAEGRWLDASFVCPAGSFLGSAAGAVVDTVTKPAAGVVLGVGDAVGVPRTNETECEKAKREGRTLDASFACPAGDFLGYAWNRWGW